MCSRGMSWGILGLLRRFRFLYRCSCLLTMVDGRLEKEGRRGARIRRRLCIAGTGRARIRRRTMPARGIQGRCRITRDRRRITQTRAITGLSSSYLLPSNYLPLNNYLLPSNYLPLSNYLLPSTYLPLSNVPTFRPFRRPTGRSLTREETRGLLVMYCRNIWSRRRFIRLG